MSIKHVEFVSAVSDRTLCDVTDSLRAFKENMKLGRFKDVDPEEQRRRDEESQRKECEEEEKARSIQVGDR